MVGESIRPVEVPRRTATVRLAVGIALSIVAVSVMHYITSAQSTVFHEVFKRLYYVPIVIAAVTGGSRGGLAASALSTILYLPHVVLRWHAWPVVEVEQYGEVLVFNVVAIVTGTLADRLHAERDRYHGAAARLQEAYADLRARNDERLRVDRLVTIGRLASGIAHEIRNPLGGLLGCLEILAPEFPRGHPKTEFVEIAKREIARLQSVVTEFLEFAQPAPPTVQPVDLGLVAVAAARLARPALACRGTAVDARPPEVELIANVDAEQVQRALLNIMLVGAPFFRDGCMVFAVKALRDIGQITIELDATASLPAVADIFEPFPPSGGSHGLAVATARRLIENQGGAVRAEVVDGRLRYIIDLPLAKSDPGDGAGRPLVGLVAQEHTDGWVESSRPNAVTP